LLNFHQPSEPFTNLAYLSLVKQILIVNCYTVSGFSNVQLYRESVASNYARSQWCCWNIPVVSKCLIVLGVGILLKFLIVLGTNNDP